MQDALQAAIDALTAVLADHEALSQTAEQLANTEAKLQATLDAHADVTKQLEDDSLLLDATRAEAIKKHDTEMYERTKQLRQLMEQVETAQAELAEVTAHLKVAHAEHDQVLASFAALRAKLG